MLAACAPVAGTPGEPYLFRRGIGLDRATAAGVLFARDWYGRPAVVFPLRDRAGRVVAASGRYLDGRQPKTRVAGDRKLGVFATPGAWDAPRRWAGAPWRWWSSRGRRTPSRWRSATSPPSPWWGQRAPVWLRRPAAFRRVVVALDADAAGDRAAEGLLRELAPFARSIERLRPPAGKDWNDALLADYGGLCDFLEARGLAVAGIVRGHPAPSAPSPRA